MNYMSAFLIIFSLLLFIANIIFFAKKKYLYLFVPCMLFLPSYYGIEINSSLPLITVTRMMFVVFYLYAFINKRRTLDIKNIHWSIIPRHYLLIGGYFIFRTVANLYYIFTYSQAIKTIFFMFFEQFLFLVALYLLAPTKQELNTLIKVIVSVATVFFVIGILESLTFIRPFDALYTVSRHVMNEHYIRLGLLRATTTFGMPGMFGNMCLLVLPLILYLFNLHQQKRYLISIGLCILAIIHSGSRADILSLIILMLIYFIYVLRDKAFRLLFAKRTLIILSSLLIFSTLASIANPYYKFFYVGTAKSILNEVGFDFDIDSDAPDSNTEYGANSMRGSISRTRQLSGLIYTSRINPLFGLGSGAQNRKDVQYYWANAWHKANTYDMGIVEIFCDEGILGLCGIIAIISSLYLLCKGNRNNFLFICAYLLSTLNTVNMFSFLFLYIGLLIGAIQYIESNH